MSDTESKSEKKPIVIRNATDLQRLKLQKLMKNPDKPVVIPEPPKSKSLAAPPDFVRNVMGSSAGAGSGEFHVYRHLRRKEYARQKFIQEKSEKKAPLSEVELMMKTTDGHWNYSTISISQVAIQCGYSAIYACHNTSGEVELMEKLEDEYHNRIEQNRQAAAERTAKKRAKRLKKKKNVKLKGKKPKLENKQNASSQSDSSCEYDEKNKETTSAAEESTS